jgi:hypothetical protein
MFFGRIRHKSKVLRRLRPLAPALRHLRSALGRAPRSSGAAADPNRILP